MNVLDPGKIMRALKVLVFKAPVTVSLVALMIVLGITSGSFVHAALNSSVAADNGYGLLAFTEGKWWTIFTGVLFASTPPGYLLLLPLTLIVCGYLEVRYGWWRMLLAFFVTHCISVLVVAGGIAAFGTAAWATNLGAIRDVGMSNGVFGALGVATASLSAFWRFRVRSTGLLIGVALVLYSGLVWDFTHLLGFLTGIALGPLVIGKPYISPRHWFRYIDARLLAASFLVFYALAHIITKLHPGNGGILQFGHSAAHAGGTFLVVLVLSFTSLWFAYGLYRGRAVAWKLSLSGAILVAAIELIQIAGEMSLTRIFTLLVSLIFVAILLLYRKQFRAQADPLTKRRVLQRLAIGAFSIAALHILVLFALRHSFTPEPTLGAIVVESVYQTFDVTTGEFMAKSTLAGVVLGIINYVWVGFIFISLAALILTTRRDAGNASKQLYVDLLEKWGGSTISWMGTWSHIHYYANTSNTAILAYRLSGSVAIVLADPVGETRAIKSLVDAFDQHCHQNGWTVAYFSSSAKTAKAVRTLGYQSVHVASDTLIQLSDLSFTGKPWQSVRSAINKAAKAGVSMHAMRYHDVTPGVREQLIAIENSWSKDKALPEMGFTLGTLHQAEDPEVRLHVAIDQQGSIHGMTSWLPVYGKGKIVGWTLDIMQRRLTDDTLPGVIEFLIAETAMTLKQEGYSFLSLSGAPLSGLQDSTDLLERSLHWASVTFEPYYGFASLHKFKQKFQPTEEAMYLCYRDPDQLSAIGVAIGRAYMGDATIRDLAAAIIHK